MTANCAVCYVTDINYLLPSLVSAKSVRKFVPPHKADVFVLLVDQESMTKELNQFLDPHHIRVIPIDSKVYSNFDKSQFRVSQITSAALGRLFIDKFLPSTCSRFVYIDGDTWVGDNISTLVDADIPDGKLAAVDDIMTFRRNDFTPKSQIIREYFGRLGIGPKFRYFNSGVFATGKKTWGTIGEDAFRFFTKNTKACEYYDQSALNAVVGDRRLTMSIKWNFQTPFRFLGIEKRINPKIYHFIGKSKPWMGACGPWKDIHPAYNDASAPFEPLNLPIKKLKEDEMSKLDAVFWKRALVQKSPLLGRLASTYLGISSYEKQVWI